MKAKKKKRKYRVCVCVFVCILGRGRERLFDWKRAYIVGALREYIREKE